MSGSEKHCWELFRRILPGILLGVLACTPVTGGEFRLAWTEVEHPDLVGYRVWHRPADGAWESAPVGTEPEHALAGLPDCATVEVAVSSIGSIGESAVTDPLVGWPRPEVLSVEPQTLQHGALALVKIRGLNFELGAEAAIEAAGVTVHATWNYAFCKTVHALVSVAPDAPLGPAILRVVNPAGQFGESSTPLEVVPGGWGLEDDDGDGVLNQFDLCPFDPDPEQSDADGDLVGDACDGTPGGLVAHWSFDSISDGHVADETGGGHDGSAEGAEAVTGVSGGAVRFSDSTARVRVPDPPSLADAVTMTAWLRPEGSGDGGWETIVDRFAWATWASGYGFAVRRGDGDVAALFGASGYGGAEGDLSLESERWQHLAVRIVGETVEFFLDGEPVAEAEADHPLQPGYSELLLGNDADLSAPFRGSLDEVRLFDLALSDTEIRGLAAVEAAMWCRDLDRDGYASPGHPACLAPPAPDCDDLDPERHPGAAEVCGDGVDQDCDGSDVECECVDADGDSFAASFCGGPDCDDGDPDVHPGAPEACDGVDRDCDGSPDPAGGCSAAAEPVAYWSMDAGTVVGTTLLDVSGNGHDGTMVSVETAPGRVGESLRFTRGLNGYVKVPDSPELDLLSGDGFTIGAFVFPDTWGDFSAGAVVFKLNLAAAEGYALDLRDGVGEDEQVAFSGVSYQSARESEPGAVSLGEWQHVAITWDGATVTFYRDGEAVGTAPGLHELRDSTRWLYIGNNKLRTQDFDGRIDEVKIFDRVLSAAELQELASP